MLEGGNPNARHHGKGLERATFCHGVELSYCLVTVRVLTETIGNQRRDLKMCEICSCSLVPVKRHAAEFCTR